MFFFTTEAKRSSDRYHFLLTVKIMMIFEKRSADILPCALAGNNKISRQSNFELIDKFF